MKHRNLILAGIILMLLIAVAPSSTKAGKLDESIIMLINPEAECLKKEKKFYLPFENYFSDNQLGNFNNCVQSDSNLQLINRNYFGNFKAIEESEQMHKSYICIPNYIVESKIKVKPALEMQPAFSKKTYDSYVMDELDKLAKMDKLEKKLTVRLALKVNF